MKKHTIKLFIGGLPPTVTKRDLQQLVEQVSPDIRILLEAGSKAGLNRGFAFLLVSDPKLAEELVASQFTIHNRKIQIQHCRSKGEDRRSHHRLFCKGIPESVSDKELTRMLNEFAQVRTAYSIKDLDGRQQNYGFVETYSAWDAQQLLSIRKFRIRNRWLVIKEFTKPSSQSDCQQHHPLPTYNENSVHSLNPEDEYYRGATDGYPQVKEENHGSYLLPSGCFQRSLGQTTQNAQRKNTKMNNNIQQNKGTTNTFNSMAQAKNMPTSHSQRLSADIEASHMRSSNLLNHSSTNIRLNLNVRSRSMIENVGWGSLQEPKTRLSINN